MSKETHFYLPRILTADPVSGKTYTEDELLKASPYLIILAEPGAGKTELMHSLAQRLSTQSIEANSFRYRADNECGRPLVIDGFDELAKIDKAGIHQLLALALKAKPTHLIVSSRSSEWSHSSTSQFRKTFNVDPLVVYLCEFSQDELRTLFSYLHPNEDFDGFVREAKRFGVDVLLSNPQFLHLLAAAYSESNGHFSSREALFAQSVKYQAREDNRDIVIDDVPLSVEQKINISAEIFTKLLLSGSEGIATSEPAETRVYPFIYSLAASIPSPKGILASRLFRPGYQPDQHRPVHKIIAEYSAAVYLTKRIGSSADPLTLRKCLSLIAPSHYVRDELRGLLGWMAACGDNTMQQNIIQLDPYAVLANGDPSQLTVSSRLFLIGQLQKLEREDPFFRRNDAWRRFSVTGFFTPEVIDTIRPLLTPQGEGHLSGLLLELLQGVEEAHALSPTLSSLVCDRLLDLHTRLLACGCLLGLKHYNFSVELARLLGEATSDSLRVASEIYTARGAESFANDELATFLRTCCGLYSNPNNEVGNISTDHYFVSLFISQLPITCVEPLLNILSDGLTCECKKQSFECYCRNGISKIIGKLLDNYVVNAALPLNPVSIWRWIEYLNFHETISADRSETVKVLQQNATLRRGVYRHVLSGNFDAHALREALDNHFRYPYHAHAGLCFKDGDQEYLLNMAFEEENVALWSLLFPHHFRNRQITERKNNPLRQLCRRHALSNPRFMQAWVSVERGMKSLGRPDQKLARLSRRMKRRREAKRAMNLQWIDSHRDEISQGMQWGILDSFARTMLSQPDNLASKFGDRNLVEQSLINCLKHISPHIPDLSEVTRLKTEGKAYGMRYIFYAACMLLFEDQGTLASLDKLLLSILRTEANHGNSEGARLIHNAMMENVDQLLFPAGQGTEIFLRGYLEPQLEYPHPPLELIMKPSVFDSIRGQLAIEWLGQYKALSLNTVRSLFKLACWEASQSELCHVITKRCEEFQSSHTDNTGDNNQEELRLFWLIRAFYFLPEFPADYWQRIIADKRNLLRFNSLSRGINREDTQHWPSLSAEKLGSILEGFVGQWPVMRSSPLSQNQRSEDGDAWDIMYVIVERIGTTEPSEGILVIKRLLEMPSLQPLHSELKSALVTLQRERLFRDYTPPCAHDVTEVLNHDGVVTVEGLRESVLYQLEVYQQHISKGEFNTIRQFKPNGNRLDEESARDVIAEWLRSALLPQGITIVKEHEVNDEKRADISASKAHRDRRLLLMIEVKGQWHKAIYTAPYEQLYELYSLTPDAGMQGIYIALWFGQHEKVANTHKHGLKSAEELRLAIIEKLPAELHKQIDVFVLDLSKEAF
ncbi:hypothetical protein ACVGX7_25160 [Enterobacter hormaechei]|nr:ATP-binding protein [Enterobacter hormaechei subsp. steigerwaltii]HAV1933247.1 ATP-binding protein [Enterobacter hormaechei subsp. steigerwaltii]HEM7461464.1 ATP-binding protein [Enterobacter hormaechei]